MGFGFVFFFLLFIFFLSSQEAGSGVCSQILFPVPKTTLLLACSRSFSLCPPPRSEQRSKQEGWGPGKSEIIFSPCFVMKLLKKIIKKLKKKGQDKNISQSCTLGLGQIKLTPALFVPFEDDNNQDFNAPRALRRHRAQISFSRSWFRHRLPTRRLFPLDPRLRPASGNPTPGY